MTTQFGGMKLKYHLLLYSIYGQCAAKFRERSNPSKFKSFIHSTLCDDKKIGWFRTSRQDYLGDYIPNIESADNYFLRYTPLGADFVSTINNSVLQF